MRGIDLAEAKSGHRFRHQQTTFCAWHRPPSNNDRFFTASPQVQAKEVATIREAGTWVRLIRRFKVLSTWQEHDQAIGDLGSLTERVAKSAIAGIQRSEDCRGFVGLG